MDDRNVNPTNRKPKTENGLLNLERALSRPVANTFASGSEAQPPSLPPGTPNSARPNGSPRREFTVLSRLGKGGTGLVLKAYDHQNERVVALKILLRRANIARVKREARALKRLDHPGIAKLYELLRPGAVRLKNLKRDEIQEIKNIHAGGWIFVMEFVDGVSLDKVRNLAPEEAVALMIQACQPLQAMHDTGLVHRDVKRANLMLTNEGKVVLIDLGLVKWPRGVTISFSDMLGTHETGLTINGSILGTPECMPPELAKGRAHRADARTDVYGLGATLSILLTGRNPFDGGVGQVITQLREDKNPIPIRKHNPKIPKPLEAIILKAMAIDPANRYQSAEALACDLRRWANCEMPKADLPGVIGATLRSWLSMKIF